jgi:hypothetical protein
VQHIREAAIAIELLERPASTAPVQSGFSSILIPLSQTMIAAIFIIMFVYGWNQYLWPTMIVTDESKYTLARHQADHPRLGRQSASA